MIPEQALNEIARIVGPEDLILDHDGLEPYSSDATKVTYPPDAVVFPEDQQEISKILELATKEGIPVVPRGAGSGMSGGALAVKGGLVMAMHRLDRILSIDQDNLTARVEPGVVTAHLQQEVEKLGLFYPPDPASLNVSTVGGNIAECAGGPRAVKYGVTKDYVLGLEVVLPTGEIIHTGVETVKGVAGYDLTRLIVGSEGTLAVITEVTLRLLPMPAARKTMIAFFPDVKSAVQTVSEIIGMKIIPSVLELLDRHCLDCVSEEMNRPVPAEAGAMLLIEVDGQAALVETEAQRIEQMCHPGRVVGFETAATVEEEQYLWEARRNVSPSLYRLRPYKISEDIVVPRSRMAELVTYLEELSIRYKLPLPAFGHAGDGNIHVNIMLERRDSKELAGAMSLVEDLFSKVIQMGGTISGEHGIGITKAPYLGLEISEPTLELMARIKQAFDPAGILNPGKIFSDGLKKGA